MNTTPKRLYRSRTDRKIAGVCGGVAHYFNIDPTFIRIIWLVLVLGAGTGLLAYLICWLVIPNEPATA
jgi:phage shock protein C